MGYIVETCGNYRGGIGRYNVDNWEIWYQITDCCVFFLQVTVSRGIVCRMYVVGLLWKPICSHLSEVSCKLYLIIAVSLAHTFLLT